MTEPTMVEILGRRWRSAIGGVLSHQKNDMAIFLI